MPLPTRRDPSGSIQVPGLDPQGGVQRHAGRSLWDGSAVGGAAVLNAWAGAGLRENLEGSAADCLTEYFRCELS